MREWPVREGCFALESSRRNCSLRSSQIAARAPNTYIKVVSLTVSLAQGVAAERTAGGLHCDDRGSQLPVDQPHSTALVDVVRGQAEPNRKSAICANRDRHLAAVY